MPNDIKKLRRLMFAANHIRKNNPVVLRGSSATQSQALKYAWWFESFRAKLATGVYRFSYVKTDGSIREARGTLCMDLVPDEKKPTSDNVLRTATGSPIELSSSPIKGRAINYDTFPYYDLEKAAWRSFRLDNFIGFVEQVE